MDLKISYNWINEYLKSKKSVAEFATEMSLKCQSVDRVTTIKPKFTGVITAKIIALDPHPNADKLRLPTVDTGKEKLQIVCGAPNIAVGQIVPLALEGAVLGEGEETMTIRKAAIRGVESNGMLCSQKELGLGDDHAGIMILPDDTPIGKDLTEVMPINDHVLDIEVTSNRPDAMSVIGLAREGAAALGLKFVFKPAKPQLKAKIKKELSVKVLENKLCPRYQAMIMTNVKVGPSPLWLQQRLLASGLRPINNLVDITNYILLEYGQPLHVFDYEKLAEQKILVRLARSGEKILALNGRVYDLKPNQLVIADGQRPVAVAGVMGGEESAATEKTETIVFEAANFDPVSVRKTARALNLYSEAQSLYEKGLSPVNTELALLRAIELAELLAGAKPASAIINVGFKDYRPKIIKLDPAMVNKCLGVSLSPIKIKKILDNLGFGVSGSKTISVKVPWFRAKDVEYDYDLVEEVARIYGYHHLPSALPSGEIPMAGTDPLLFWEQFAKEKLAAAGLTETFNYSFVSEKILNTLNRTEDAIKLANPLNEEMEYMRVSLIPGILGNVADNYKSFSQIKIFELSNVYLPKGSKDLPREYPCLTMAVVFGKENPFLSLKGKVEYLLKQLGINDYEYLAVKNDYWQKDQAFAIKSGNEFLGEFGLVGSGLLSKFNLNLPVGLLDLNFQTACRLASSDKVFTPLPAYPESSRDLAVILDKNISWQQILTAVKNSHGLMSDIKYLSTYTDKQIGEDKKSLAFSLVFRSPERTLKSEEVDLAVKKIMDILEEKFQVKLR